MSEPPPLLPAPLFSTSRDDRLVRRSLARGEALRLRRGIHAEHDGSAPPRDAAGIAEAGRRLTLLRAQALSATIDDAIFSHSTAVALWGLDWLGEWPERLHTTDRGTRPAQTRSTFTRHRGPLLGPDIRLRSDLRVTSRARTVADVLLTRPAAESLVTLDDALRSTFLSADDIANDLSGRKTARGSRRASETLAFGDPKSMSAGESISRLRMRDSRFVAPVLQESFFDHEGRIGDVDFWWPGYGIIGEFDGHGKYLRDVYLKGRSPAQVVIQEKQREDRLRAHRLVRRVVRWGWADLEPLRLEALLIRAGVPRI
ncbi:hypothetical protein [Frondihabitans cladoniiphilus]|uniref:Transcriptional regulator, AbiEi antitoxin, Type IV TA system n=1 Tax=Frondihabitans cladoniiphilus TaxID=715785 RepID=A0ABP8VKA8_9MICO